MSKSKVKRLSELSLHSAKEHQVLIGIVGSYTLLALILSHYFSEQKPLTIQFIDYGTTFIMGPVFALCAYTIYVMIAVRPARLSRFLFNEISNYLTLSRLAQALPVMILFPVFTATFSYFKTLIPTFHPYSWDLQLSRLDQVIHGGNHPWELLQPLLGYPLITSFINICYHLWFFLIFASIYWIALYQENSVLRMRFLLSFIISWILLGNILSTVLSSLGPCYFGFIFPEQNPYASLMAYLHKSSETVPLWALKVQQLLWDDYQERTGLFGISAMPSMHVASSVLVALLGAKINRFAGYALLSFALIIMLGSVHLGWHYALDGYVGAIGACLIWQAVGWAISQSNEAKLRNDAPAVAIQQTGEEQVT